MEDYPRYFGITGDDSDRFPAEVEDDFENSPATRNLFAKAEMEKGDPSDDFGVTASGGGC